MDDPPTPNLLPAAPGPPPAPLDPKIRGGLGVLLGVAVLLGAASYAATQQVIADLRATAPALVQPLADRLTTSTTQTILAFGGLAVLSGALLGLIQMLVRRYLAAREQAATALQASTASFRLLFASNPLPMWVYDRETLQFLEVNAAAARQYGYSGAEFGQLRITDIRPAEDLPRLQADLAAPRHSLQGASEWRHQRKNGEVFDVAINSHTLEWAGRPAVLVVAQDISARKRAEALDAARLAAEAANTAKSDFLSRMSHELRTPLNSILGFAQLLELENLSTAQDDSVRYILKAGRHLLMLINEVLDISRIEGGHLTVSLEPIPLAELLVGCLDLMQPLADARQVSLPSLPPALGAIHVQADRHRLNQVLLNLLTNAVKYNRVGGEIGLAVSEVRPGWVRVAVSDTGLGIAPEQIGRLFRPFERLDAAHSEVEGTGLGLALSQRLMEVMGGRLGVESTVDVGSTFWIELPLGTSPVAVFDQSGGTPLAPALTTGAARMVLYIEDNLTNLKLIEHILQRRPEIRILAALQGRLGVDLAREHRPDLILLDLNLPDLSGLDVLRELQRHPATWAIPVVVISADATPGQIARLEAAGARAYLTKPLDVAEFQRLVLALLYGAD